MLLSAPEGRSGGSLDFDAAWPFVEDRAAVVVDGRMGFIERGGAHGGSAAVLVVAPLAGMHALSWRDIWLGEVR